MVSVATKKRWSEGDTSESEVLSGSLDNHRKRTLLPPPRFQIATSRGSAVRVPGEAPSRSLDGEVSLEAPTSLNVDELWHLLDFFLKNAYFSANGAYGQQLTAMAMVASILVTTGNRNLATEVVEE
ncbi:hypothetical protein HPB50_028666 [Hyalomma asiaticum]|nr:hypothetical protein HPB50_028666 [Hyalomma asiaticum]